MSISAMKCALQSLESVEKVKGWNKDSIVGRHCTQSAHFLRQAIAEEEEAVAAEREACAKVCIKLANKWTRLGAWGENNEFHECAEAIRARGEK